MNKIKHSVCLFAVIVFLLASPVCAQEGNTRSNAYITSYDSYIYREADNVFQVWFQILGTGMMDEIGVSSISVQRSSTGTGDWTTMEIYYPEDYPQMIAENDFTHTSYVTHKGTRGYYYRAVVVFYAAKGNGSGGCTDYAETIYIPLSGNGGRSQ